MAGQDQASPSDVRGYVVFRQVEPGLWQLVGDVDHRPGLAMRAERAQAVRDATGGADPANGAYAALPRNQWHLVRSG
ncbi:MAG: hypothetical protein WBH47_23335 [Streptosporangiaceae bacterium]